MKRKRNYLKLILSLVLFIVILLLPFIVPSLIKIKNIECKSQFGPCPEGINSKLVHEVMQSGRNPKNLSKTKIEIRKTLENNYLVQDYSLQYKYPHTLEVNLVVKKPEYALNNALVDKDGFVIASSENPNLPTVNSNGTTKNIGERVTDEELFALQLMNGLYKMYQVNHGKKELSSLTVELSDTLAVIFPLEPESKYDLNYYLGAVRMIVTKAESEFPGKYKELDLRFANPVLR